jgi:transposase
MERRLLKTSDGLEWRRLQAWHLKQSGWRPSEIAVALGISMGAISQWLKAATTGGVEALLSHTSPGRPSRPSPEQRRLVPDFLWHGAEAYGFRGDVWTCGRVAGVLEAEFGIRYSNAVERLPSYAPDLNPWDTGGWDHLKHVELRNVTCLDLDALHLELHLAIGRRRQKPHLAPLFFKAAGLVL